jgi:hypothetical protein
LGFLNLAFLFGLVAIAVPVIIHLLNRRRVKRIKFSSLEFLEEANRQRMRRVNLRRILILILRTLAVLAIVIAFARPTLRSGFLFAGSAPKNVIICLDASYSMGVNQETGTAFDAARKISKDIVDEAASNDEINLIVFSKTAEPALESGTRNRGVVKSAIDRATLSNEVTSLRTALDRALGMMKESDVNGGEIYVVSDFRYSTDSTLVDDEKTPANVRIYFIPAYDDDADNVSIDRVTVPRKLLRPGEVVKVNATVSNHAKKTPANVSLELVVEGDRKAEQVLELAPGASQTVTFPLSLAKPGRYHGRASKNHDRLPVDDDRYFLVEVSNSIPVAVVGGRRRATPGEEATTVPPAFYVEKALNPRGVADGEFRMTSVAERDVTASSLPAGGVVVWVSPQEMEPRRMALLERHVRRGGGMLVSGRRQSRRARDAAFRALLGARRPTCPPAAGAFTSFEETCLQPVHERRARAVVALAAECLRRRARRGAGFDHRLRGWRRSRGVGVRARPRPRAGVRGVARPRLGRHSPFSMFLPLVHVGHVSRELR